ncbi:MAG: caspase family protein [candidate division KSB1 bacterium]|nr:caspase family protein [candidate division KSB1 bacterium]MDZ7273149.1 caspase family protein [candidate division KSB1 bacterium]MDZ7285251.1 caspase family protein [candidate division KSB1 bacterium]MDZ7298283.1 caspase family protein [candidate division KSB1 bacterium]MDZ7306636.1 caspase family protein [candidate division KSB1 bacterium]
MDKPPQFSAGSGERYAVLIGINHYRDPGIPPLQFARNDATALRDLLIDPRWGLFRKENVHLLVDEQATAGDIRSQLVYWLGANVSENDDVWLFFAGRGATLATQPVQHALLGHDTLLSDLEGSVIPLDRLADWLQLVTAARIIIVLDCGFNVDGDGRALATSGVPVSYDDSFLAALSQGRQRYVLAAAMPHQTCLEDPELQHGLLSYILLRQLQSDASGEIAGRLSWEALYQFLAVAVPRCAEQLGAVQNPIRLGSRENFPLLAGQPPQMHTVPVVQEGEGAEYVRALLLQAQEAARLDQLEKAQELFGEILRVEPGNRRAQRGLQIVQAESARHQREQRLKELFVQARRHLDEKNYAAALQAYQAIQQLDPTSKSAALGVESCQALMRRERPGSLPVEEAAPVEAVVRHRHLKPYDRYIWPYIGWWSLLVCCWKIFSDFVDPNTPSSFLQAALQWAFLGAIIGLLHASLNYGVIKLVRLLRRRRLLNKA